VADSESGPAASGSPNGTGTVETTGPASTEPELDPDLQRGVLPHLACGDEPVTILEPEARRGRIDRTTTIALPDALLRIELAGPGALDWERDAARFSITALHGTSDATALRISGLGDPRARVAAIRIDRPLGRLESDAPIERIELTGAGALAGCASTARIGALHVAAPLGQELRLEAELGRLQLDAELTEALRILGDVGVVVLAGKLGARALLALDGNVGELRAGGLEAGGTIDVGGRLGRLQLAGRELAGIVAVDGDAGTIEIDADGFAGSLIVRGDLGALRVRGDLRSGARIVLHGDATSVDAGGAMQRNAMLQVLGDVTGDAALGRVGAGARIEFGGEVARLALLRELDGRVTIDGRVAKLAVARKGRGEVDLGAGAGELEYVGRAVPLPPDAGAMLRLDAATGELRRQDRAETAGGDPSPRDPSRSARARRGGWFAAMLDALRGRSGRLA
jgi:hypothetical protein